MLDVGADAPGFELPDQNGETVSLAEFEGQRVLLYFYPKAKTPGCETEARRFRDLYGEFQERDVAVVGISPDSVDRLAEFADEENLPFRLLSDTNMAVADAYDSRGEKVMRGQQRDMTFRNSYLIGPEGTVEAAYESVMPYDHPSDVLEDVAEINRAGE